MVSKAVHSESPRRRADFGDERTKILVVEDELPIARVLMRQGRICGYEMHHVGNGLDAIEAWERIRPDVVLLDIGLPGLDGRDVLVRVQKKGLARGTVVVFLTGRDAQHDRRLGLELGADDYETKPFIPNNLFYRVTRLFERRSIKDELAAYLEDELANLPAVD